MTVRARSLVIVLLVLTAGAGSVRAGQSPYPWVIVPGVNVGAITRTAGEIDLIRAYGRAHVRTQNIELGEGVVERGTVLFPDDPTRTVGILWKDLQQNRMPERIQITGTRSLWRTAEGITLGTSLVDLERLNGRPFVLMGFGWDYGGTVIAWERGRVARTFTTNGRVILRLAPPQSAPRKAIDAVSGDREFRSSHRAMQQINPRVYQIVIEFK